MDITLNAIKIQCKVMTWRGRGSGFSLKVPPAPLENELDEGKRRIGGATTKNPGEMITAWAKRMMMAQNRRSSDVSGLATDRASSGDDS